ncbi:MAG: tyrosine-type recombinase/integrase [bacterium]
MRIYKREESWYVDFVSKDGARVRQKVGTSKKKAEEVLREIKLERLKKELGVTPEIKEQEEKERVTLEKFSQDYMKYSETNKTPMYSKLEKSVLSKKIIPFFKNKYLDDINPKEIEDYKASRAKQVTNASVNRELACFKHLYTMAIKWGYAKDNPVKKVDMMKEPPGRLRYLTISEINKLIDNCAEHLKPIVIIALNTGMRRGEILKLKWGDIDFSNNRIIVQNSKNNEKRVIPMNKIIYETLKDNYKDYSLNKRLFDINDCKKSFKTALRKTGIDDFRFHDLRHTFASHLAMKGANIKTIQTLLGHKDINMTLRYAHLGESYLEKAVESLYKNNA